MGQDRSDHPVLFGDDDVPEEDPLSALVEGPDAEEPAADHPEALGDDEPLDLDLPVPAEPATVPEPPEPGEQTADEAGGGGAPLAAAAVGLSGASPSALERRGQRSGSEPEEPPPDGDTNGDTDENTDGASVEPGDEPPGDQPEQEWYDEEGLRWRSRDGGYIWYAEDGQIWNAQTSELIRGAADPAPAESAPEDIADDVAEPDPEPEQEPPAPSAERREEPAPAPPATRTGEPTGGGEIPAYVEYRPSDGRRRLLALVCALAAVGAAATVVWAVSTRTQTASGLAIAATGFALACLWLLLNSTPTTVAINDTVLSVSKGRETEAFDLTDPTLPLQLTGNPQARSWKATVTRPDGSLLLIPASSVHAEEFERIVRHHRSGT